MDKIQRILAIVDSFPTLPTIYTELAEIMADQNATNIDVANIISKDQSSSSKILRAANSPIYGLVGRVSNISQAIFFIGFDEVKNLVLALSVINIFKQTDLSEYFNIVDIWKHSIAVGIITRNIAEYIRINDIENFFVAGILHDLGILLYVRYLEKDFIEAIRYSYEKKISLRESEMKIIGMSHYVAGELLAEKWKLPLQIRNAIRYHSSGISKSKNDILTALIHISNITAKMLDLGESCDKLIPEPTLDVWKLLNLPDNIFSVLYPKIIGDFKESLEIFMLN